MARQTYLERRGSVYYARIDIPLDLVEHFGTKTWKKSLRTTDLNAAKVALLPVVTRWRAEFEDVRRRREYTAEDKAAAIWKHYQSILASDDQARLEMPTPQDMKRELENIASKIRSGELKADDEIGRINSHIDYELMAMSRSLSTKHRKHRLNALRKSLIDGDASPVAPAVKSYLAQQKLIIAEDSTEFRDLASGLIRAEIQAIERTLERDNGDFSGVPNDPIVTPAASMSREVAAPGERIAALFENYVQENPNRVKPDTINQARRDVGLFIDFVGPLLSVGKIDKKRARDWKSLLMKYPVKAAETKIFNGMSMAQIAERNQAARKPVISTKTVNRHLNNLSAFCRWLVNHGYLDNNPMEGLLLKKTEPASPQTFTTGELNTLFQSPLFTGCKSDRSPRFWDDPGPVKIRDHRYWLPLIMLFSGARPAEIAQLATTDVRQEHGCWIMHITTEGEGDKSVKTKGSMRVVPIHSKLIQLGLLDYHAQMLAKSEPRLFPRAERNQRGQMIADFSREFPRYLERIGLKQGRGLSLYSLRHGVTDALRRAGYLDAEFGYILGHTEATMTQKYGTLPQGMIDARVKIIEGIKYTGLHLEHLIVDRTSVEAA